MSQKVNSTETGSNEPIEEDFQRGQQIKGVIALVGVVVGIIFLLIGFSQMGAV